MTGGGGYSALWQSLPVIGGLVGGFLNSKRARKFRRSQDKNLMLTMSMYDDIIADQDVLWDEAEDIMRLRPELVAQGYERAREQIQFAGSSARAQVGDTFERSRADMESRAQQTGLYNTTVPSNYTRGAYSDATRHLVQIQQDVGDRYAELELGELGTGLQTQGDLANFLLARNQNMNRLRETKANIFGAGRGVATPGFPNTGQHFAQQQAGRIDWEAFLGALGSLGGQAGQQASAQGLI